MENPSEANDNDDNTNVGASQVDERDVIGALVEKETRAVKCLRITVLIFLTIVGALLSATTYTLTRNDQITDFEEAFDTFASELINSFHKAVEKKLEAVDSLSAAVTSYALGTNSTFPYVTLPNFEIQGGNTRILSGTVAINYAPLVSDDDRESYEKFSRDNEKQFTDCIAADTEQQAMQDSKYLNSTRYLQEMEFFRFIHNLAEKDVRAPNNTGPYLPIWQQSPAVPFGILLNFNLLSHPTGQKAYREAIRTGTAVLDFADNMNQEAYLETGYYIQLTLSHGQYRDVVDEFLGDPSSIVAYPVFDSFDVRTRKVSGIMSTYLYWKLYFSRILPPNARGIICVMSNNFNQTFSYRVDGPDIAYLGPGDMHDPKYDHLVHYADVNKYIDGIASKTTRSYTSADLNNEFGQYYLRVYPSDDTLSGFRNARPIYYTIVVAGVIFFTSCVFLVYDGLVQRRQKMMMNRAVASGNIVSSLFPDQVRDKLYEANEQKKEAPKSSIFESHAEGDIVRSDAPIMANLFDETTILFADIAGFTSWSSSRSPEQVFELLETIYAAFDEIAERRGVFKVETIGDCYVAVTGLPKPQAKHAVIMAKFANDCLLKLREVMASLSERLGEDTAALELRVGLHSGSVTAGVLRAQKSRFQLFGPTMNQASRMESTGVPGRIQVSQETADELSAHGKSHWLQTRRDKIQAKGLGELDTYFVNVDVL